MRGVAPGPGAYVFAKCFDRQPDGPLRRQRP
jgi:hypothetical protein